MKILKIITILVFTVILQGCIAILAGSTAVATKIAQDPRTLGTQIDDNLLKLRVTNELVKDQQIRKYTHIIVTAYQNKILLTGQSPKIELIKRAKLITSNISGIREIYNEIRNVKKVDFVTKIFDTWITTKIYVKLLTNNIIKLCKLKIITENNEVFVMGIVTQQEAESIVNLISHIRSIDSINTIFSIKNI
ncbi:division/outer membrane stress-associated lipid-binding lipoprotein [Pantoea sp. Mhis]|uniref:division/outer membrane stress-associated lipid-binding lipoprotein n=1 Tax=Pantoea sp. Mhis TaxID=2576759 RepID=UPI00135A4B58|nr:division/outer membrane stress-associated lipid-binding lipoprotein [Pantoea sp. Mhis]MXP56393.1 divisome-associated lipoprotein YraP [Pantoea sp. Mhis]